MRVFPGIVALALLGACSQQAAEPRAEKAWVRLPAAEGRPGAAFFTITGGSAADTLLAVTSPAVLRTEMHESGKDASGMMRMTPMANVPVPAGATIAFAPGGRHVMLYSIGPAVKPGASVPLTLAFASGKRIDVQAKVTGPGGSAPD